MPCRTDPPSQNAIMTHKCAKHIVFVYGEMPDANNCRQVHPPKWVLKLAERQGDTYDKRIVPLLCQTIKEMTEEERNRILFNPRDRRSRDLANWWEDHGEADAEREEAEKKAKQREAIRNELRLKLSSEEREAVDLE